MLLTPVWQAAADESKLRGCAVTNSLFDLQELAAASRTVAQAMAPTPQLCWPLLCEAVGTEVWVKHENHTPIAAFKPNLRDLVMDVVV